MGSRYELAPRPIGPSSHRRVALVVVMSLAFIGLVLVKPWGTVPAAETTTADLSLLAPSVAPAPAAASPLAPLPTSVPVPASMRGWPVVVTLPRATGNRLTKAELLMGRLASRSSGWGVGDGGGGPRIAHDEEWVDLRSVSVAPATDTGGNIQVWPGAGLCTGVPVLEDAPSFIAVAAPPGHPQGWRLTGWWTDGTRIASLAGSVRQIASQDDPGLRYLERLDGTRWPAGRYEIHVLTGDRTLALTLCL